MARLLKVIANNMRFKLATIACLRMLISLAGQATARRWMLNQHQYWVQDWLLGSGSEGVRQTAEQLIVALLAPSPPRSPLSSRRKRSSSSSRQAASVGGSEGASGAGGGGEGVVHGPEPPPPEPPANEEEKELEEQRHQMVADACTSGMYDHLLSLLPYVTDVAKDLGGRRTLSSPATSNYCPMRTCRRYASRRTSVRSRGARRNWRYAVRTDPSVDDLL